VRFSPSKCNTVLLSPMKTTFFVLWVMSDARDGNRESFLWGGLGVLFPLVNWPEVQAPP